MMLVGDTTGTAYPESGEGIGPAIESALLAATTAIEAGGDFQSARLESYRRRTLARSGKPTGNLRVPAFALAHWLLPVAGFLLDQGWFSREIVMKRWFLHATIPDLAERPWARGATALTDHYDLPAEFFSVWLDSAMVYSCAYFKRAEDSLEVAQQQKLELVCRKLRLRPGQRMLDLGCGWGGLDIHAAGRPGVHAIAITLSAAQARWAQSQIAELGLEDRCQVFHADCMASRATSISPFSADSFSPRYVFPDAELEPVSTELQAAERVGFEIRDV
jgi:hypothetical protein